MSDATERKLEWACRQIESLLKRVADLEQLRTPVQITAEKEEAWTTRRTTPFQN